MRKGHREESLRWLAQAADEFQDAEDLRKRGRFYIALFHFQQAAEKALKAYLYMKVRSTDVFFTHSIDELSKMAVEMDPDFRAILPAKKLDRYYIPTRYPNALPGGVPSRYFDDPDEARTAMELGENVIKLAERKIKGSG